MTGEHTSVIYGTHYPNRLFVGCLPPEAGAEDLGEFFSDYGNVVEAKVVLDSEGRSKRFGFVTFSNSDNVAELIKNRAVVFQGKMINVGPAVKKNIDTELRTKSQTKAPKTCGPQHMPKTIIRRSPTEQVFFPEFHHVKQRDETSFRSLWGISNKRNSVWSGPKNTRNSNAASIASSQNSDDLSDDQNKSTCSSQDGSLNNSIGSGSFWNIPTPRASMSDSWRYNNYCNTRQHQQQHAIPSPVGAAMHPICPPSDFFKRNWTQHYRK